MTDREKVISTLEEIKMQTAEIGLDSAVIAHKFIDKILVLLKEQDPVKPKSKVRHGENGQIQHWCGNCMAMLHGKPKYCSNCGRQVKWE